MAAPLAAATALTHRLTLPWLLFLLVCGSHRSVVAGEPATDNVTTTTATSATAADSTNTNKCMVDTMSPVSGLRAELQMLSRQARGLVRINTNCQLQVEMLEVALDAFRNETSIELYWYGADSLEFDDVDNRSLLPLQGVTMFKADMLTGNSSPLVFEIDQMMTPNTGNTTTSNPDGNSHFKYEDLSQVGAIFLCEGDSKTDNEDEQDSGSGKGMCVAQALIQKLKPGPAADLLANQPTYFENCLGVSNNVRIRWTIVDEAEEENAIDFGIEYVVNPGNDATNTWVAFGPAEPGIQDRIMGGSDIVVAGFRVEDAADDEESLVAFAEDYYIGGYEVCTKLQKPFNGRNYDGVCSDSVWSSTSNDEEDDTDDVQLIYSHVFESVALLRYRRKLVAPEEDEFDHSITLGTKQHFVWAKGPLDPTQGIAEVQFHGYQFGQIRDIDMNEPTWSCPPLQGVELYPFESFGGIDPSEDKFAQMFEHRAILQGDSVEVFWTLQADDSKIHIGVRQISAGSSSSKWVSVAVGDSMTDSWAWVATLADSGGRDHEPQPHLLAYRMGGLDASSVRLAGMEEQNDLIAGPHTVNVDHGRIAFEVIAQWPLPGMKEGSTSSPLIWAIGPSWRGPSSESPQRKDEHSLRSKSPTTVDFLTGETRVGSGPKNPLLVAHGAIMWLAWMVLAPATAVASRYMRDDPCLPQGIPSWITLHKFAAATVWYLNVIGFVLAIVAAGTVGLPHFFSTHSKVGLTVVSMVTVQNFWALFRPPADKDPEDGSKLPMFTKRRVWSWSHRLFAVTMLILAIVAVITGSKSLPSFDSTTQYGVQLSVVWVVVLVLCFGVYEYRKTRITTYLQQGSSVDSLTNEEDDDLFDTDADDPDMVGSKKMTNALPSWKLVYAVPWTFGVVLLAILAAVAFSGLPEIGSQSTRVAASESTGSSGDEPAIAYRPSSSDAPEGCTAWPPSHIGDGWCDDHEPFNTKECNWDGGDCCNMDASLYNCRDPSSPNYEKSSPKGWTGLAVPRNPRYTVTREESLESFVTTYNNYYEFGLSKDISDEAMKHTEFLHPDSWYVDISGLVENPMTLDVTALVNQMHLEERLYRHRCVEAWSITAPWIGFPLAKLLDLVKPKPEAAIVQFISWKNFTHSKIQSGTSYPWPYTEALTIEEARNELAMLTVGAFGKLLTPQNGAPIRLTVPWKYGFKSVKSIEKINFLPDDDDTKSSNRRTFWSTINGVEYGFYANINPDVPHRRWSQATERHYVTGFPGTRLPTTRMNGYKEQVDYMYTNLDGANIYY